MDKFKNLVTSRDGPDTEGASGPTGRVTGQGTHFPRREEQLVGDTAGLQGAIAGGKLPEAKRDSEIIPASGLPASGSGTAAISETTIYSSHTLPQGDTVRSVIDTSYRDPTTYQMSERSYASSRGVPEGGPLAAAAAAFHKDRDYSTSNIPGAFPKEPAYESVTVAPSTLTTAVSPADGSATRHQAENTRVPDASAAAQSATRAATIGNEPVSEEPKKTSTLGKILGAVGLGAAGAGAEVAASRARNDGPQPASTTGADSYTAPTQPNLRADDVPPPAVGISDMHTTTTGVDSYTAPTQSTSAHSVPPPGHRRKESIPTTAYPAGLDSPAPISAPVGGTTAAPEQEPKDHTGRNIGLAAAGVGAAGAYALQSRHPETEQSDWPLRDDSAVIPTTGTVPSSQRTVETQPTAFSTKQQEYAPYNAPTARDTGATAPLYTDGQSQYDDRSRKDATRQETTFAGTGTATSTLPERDEEQVKADEEAERRRRREKEAALAGVAGAGAGAAGLHEYNKHHHEEDDARRQKDLSEQEEARRKQFEKDQKAAAKETKKEEKQQAKDEKAAAKEEKKYQKELEKEEKRHQKQLEKEEKQQQKELERVETAHDKAAAVEHERQEKQAREERERREKEAAAAAGIGADVGTAAYEIHDKESHPPPTTATDESGRTRLHKDPPEEKKPSLLKRIFRRRKNKDTGEEEEYEDDEGHDHEQPEPEHGDHHLAATGIGAGTVAGTAAATSHEPPTGSYEAASGGAQKPSYNPFRKDDPTSAAGAPGTSASANPPAPNGFAQAPNVQHNAPPIGPGAISSTQNYPPYDRTHDPSSQRSISQQGEHLDHIGGLMAGHPYVEGEEKPGLMNRAVDALKPLPEREQLQQHAEEFHHGGGGSNTHGTAGQ